jgi:uridine kinase
MKSTIQGNREMISVDKKVTLRIFGENRQYAPDTTYEQIAKEYASRFENDIVLVKLNNNLRELRKRVTEDGELEFVTTSDKAGFMTYKRSVVMLMQVAARNVKKKENYSVHVMHSIGDGNYCELENKEEVTQEFLLSLKIEMMRLVDEDLPIEKEVISTSQAMRMFEERGMYERVNLFKYRLRSTVSICKLDGYYDYYYGHMVNSTGVLKYFDLCPYEDGFMLIYPKQKTPTVIDEFKPLEKFYGALKEGNEWGRMLGIGSIGALNDKIAAGEAAKTILVMEALQEKRIADIAARIASDPRKKFVLIAGPSSSGKTTFSHRLSIQLTAQGLIPHPISLDDYYVDREFTPRDENGEYDFECLEAIDVEQFNKDMTALQQGKKVHMPTFNFKTGLREYAGKTLQLGEEDVLVIEGIHGLNEKLSYALDEESKFRIYISALTQLNIDEHNALPTTDGRLIRRMVRDARTRNTPAQATFARWDSVRRGEELHIFPHQENVDVMFNSALIYELAVLKPYAVPLLMGIDHDSPEYVEAKRLLKMLDYVLPIPGEDIAKNSIIREFIGGSIFNV